MLKCIASQYPNFSLSVAQVLRDWLSEGDTIYLGRYKMTFLRPLKLCTHLLLKHFVNEVTNVDVQKAFLSVEPMTLDEARKEACLKRVISYALFTSPLDLLVLGSSSAGSWDMGILTYVNGALYNESDDKNQLRYRFNGFQRRPNRSQ